MMSHLGVSDVIYSDVIDSFISEILKYESSVIVSLTEKPWAVLFTPFFYIDKLFVQVTLLYAL